MARKGTRRDDRPASPKRLRKRLQKAEARLAVAREKHDRAQARLEAVGIIVDEMRATLAEVEKAAARDAAAALGPPATPGTAPRVEKAATTRSPRPGSASASRRAPAARTSTRRSPAAGPAGRAGTGTRATKKPASRPAPTPEAPDTPPE
jgi:hypothetical protein